MVPFTEFMENKRVKHLRFDVTTPFVYYGNSLKKVDITDGTMHKSKCL